MTWPSRSFLSAGILPAVLLFVVRARPVTHQSGVSPTAF
jgi:hypothetical protein